MALFDMCETAAAQMYPKGRMSHHFRQMKEGDFQPVLGPVVNPKLLSTSFILATKSGL